MMKILMVYFDLHRWLCDNGRNNYYNRICLCHLIENMLWNNMNNGKIRYAFVPQSFITKSISCFFPFFMVSLLLCVVDVDVGKTLFNWSTLKIVRIDFKETIEQ